MSTGPSRLSETNWNTLLRVQVFNPYNNPYPLPFPASAQPTAVTSAPGLNYPQASSGGVMALAGATEFFGLRFSGDRMLIAGLRLGWRLGLD